MALGVQAIQPCSRSARTTLCCEFNVGIAPEQRRRRESTKRCMREGFCECDPSAGVFIVQMSDPSPLTLKHLHVNVRQFPVSIVMGICRP